MRPPSVGRHRHDRVMQRGRWSVAALPALVALLGVAVVLRRQQFADSYLFLGGDQHAYVYAWIA